MDLPSNNSRKIVTQALSFEKPDRLRWHWSAAADCQCIFTMGCIAPADKLPVVPPNEELMSKSLGWHKRP